MINKKFIASLLLLGLCLLLGGFFLKDFSTKQTGGEYRNITNEVSSYNADAEIIQALEQMKQGQEQAIVITRSDSNQRQIALTFDGLTDRTTMQQLVDLLKKYQGKATFFVDGVQTAEDPQTVVNIKEAGQRIENYTLSGVGQMENLPVERLVKDFSLSRKIIKMTTGQEPTLLKCNDTKYTDQLLQAAKAAGFKGVVTSDVFLNVNQMRSPAAADAFVSKLKPGSIVSIKLKTAAEPVGNEQGKADMKPAIDKQPGLKEPAEQLALGEKEIVDAVEKLLTALNKANYTTAYVDDFFLRQGANDAKSAGAVSFAGKVAALVREQASDLFSIRTVYAAATVDNQEQEIKTILTTEPALAFTFGGLSDETAVNDVLGRLNALGIKATFFVMEIEMQRYPGTVRRIIENGHEVGIAIRPKDGESADETRQTIIRGRTMLEEQFGVTTNLVKQPWGTVADSTKEAVFALGCKLIGQSVNVVQSKHKDYTSADQVMAEIFGKSVFSLARGQIVHFRMDYYTDNRLIGDLMETIKQRKVDNIAYRASYDNPADNQANDSQYAIKPVGEILNHTKFLYQYPPDPQNIPAHLRNDGNWLKIDQHNFMDEVSKRYIGHKNVNYEDRMLGFSKMDIRRLDMSGLIHTEENVVFLTFDDWGTDASINKILYVLRKHNVHGTFFVITNNVLNNPNLLRAIAMQGHDIGSHSDKHKPMAVLDPKTGKQVQTQNQAEYTEDVGTAYQKLRNIIGDVTVNGKSALTRFFRPPTLAVSKMGVEALFANGYEYIVSGSFSTNDYKAENVPQLVRTFKDGVYTETGEVKKGAILVMHMGDNSLYTAMALDILLTANEGKADSDPSKFKVGRLSDYLIDGYSQINRQQSLKLTAPDRSKVAEANQTINNESYD